VRCCGSIEHVSHHHTFAEVSLLRFALCLAAFVHAVEEEGDGCGALLAARTYGTLPNNAGALFCALFSFSGQNRHPRGITFEQHSIEVEIISVFFKD
jgi:hypothetical protein